MFLNLISLFFIASGVVAWLVFAVLCFYIWWSKPKPKEKV